MRWKQFVNPQLRAELMSVSLRNYTTTALAIGATARMYGIPVNAVLILMVMYIIERKERDDKTYKGYIKVRQIQMMFSLITGIKDYQLQTMRPLKKRYFVERYRGKIGKYVLNMTGKQIIHSVVKFLDTYAEDFEQVYKDAAGERLAVPFELKEP